MTRKEYFTGLQKWSLITRCSFVLYSGYPFDVPPRRNVVQGLFRAGPCADQDQYDTGTRIHIIKGFWTIVFIFIVISTTFRSICPPTFFGCLSNSRTFTELRTTSFIESTRVVCSDSVSHNRVPVLSIPVLLFACNQDWTCNLQVIVSLEA